MISFNPFWNMLKKRSITTYDLEYHYNFNPAEISRLKNNHNFTLKSMEKYCQIFNCEMQDIVTFVDDEDSRK